MNKEEFKQKLKTIPKKPGCYQMKDCDNKIIYVGKAKNLYNRVNSYFIGSHDLKTTKLVSLICDFEYIITSSETEAFILEINLIKKYNPKYNIMLTDDKTYPYICLTNEKEPRLFYTRETNYKLGKYYGPYPNAKAARETVTMLNRLYPLRKCRHIPKKECVYYHIHQCLGPCINKIDAAEWEVIKNKINNILKGNAKEEVKSIKNLMEEASKDLNFEKAIEYRNLLNDLEVISVRQKMEGFGLDTDVFGYYYNNEVISIQVFHLREGKMLERSGYLFDNYANYLDVYEKFIVDFYLNANHPFPNNIIIKGSCNKDSNDALKNNLESVLQHRIDIPKQGKKLEIVKLVCTNAQEKIDALIKKKELEYQKTEGAVLALAKLLNLESLHTIEAIDNSNISGESAVSVVITFTDGKPNKQLYRKFKIKTVVGANDVATMYEVASRRYRDPNNNPDLLIVDGGKTQVNSIKRALRDNNRQINVLGLIKNDGHHTDSLLYDDKIIPLAKNSFEFRLLEQIQDEVHRYAIAYFHTTHSKKTFASRLDNIKGIGPAKRKQILLALGKDDFQESLKKLKLNEEQIKEVMKLLCDN